jgi:hypothetical protein
MSVSPSVRECDGRDPARARRSQWRTVLTVMGAAAAACTKDAPPPPPPAVIQPPAAQSAPVDTSKPADPAQWDAAAGSVLYLPGDAGFVQLVLPRVLDDSVEAPNAVTLPAGAAPASLDLLGTQGLIGQANVGSYSADAQPNLAPGCDAWPVAPIQVTSASAVPVWQLALTSGVARAIPMDSIESLSSVEATRLVVEINRAAAVLAIDSGGVLKRIPFSVSKAYRARIAGETDVLIALVERRRNVEADPRVERSVLILERAAKARQWRAVWSETQYGTEDDLIAIDVLTLVQFSNSAQPRLFLSRDFGDGSRLDLIERLGPGKWTLRWSSAYTGC